MYEDYYGLSGRPFQLTPDARFWFDTATHKRAMAYLGYGLDQGEGFIVITGDIGAGKTTLVGHLTDTLDPERLNVIKIVSSQITADELLRTVCAGLGIDGSRMPKAQMLGAIERGLHAVARGGRRTLLVVDEAQALPIESLEELRMLSNFQAGGHAILQIFLLGQPEFRDLMHDGRLEQLRQRVIAMHHLGPMEADEVEPYLAHRLGVVGWTGRPDFETDAVEAIYAWSGGIPRRINQLASRVLLHGAIEQIDVFTADDVAMVAADLDGDSAPVAKDVGEPEAIEAAPELPIAGPAHEAEPATVRPIRADADPVAPPPPVAPVDAAEEPAARASVLEPSAAPSWLVEADEVVADPEPQPAAVADLESARRLAGIERRLEEQDEALRRVLALLVEWVEGDGARGVPREQLG
jgi:putative secretion ATPase (PEP-CTERM system associated)